MKNNPFIVFSLLLCTTILAQSGKISGTVHPLNDSIPLQKVAVVCKKNNTIIANTTTNQQGFYSLNQLPLDSIAISFSHLGYNSKTNFIKLSKQNPTKTVNVSLSENIQNLDEIEINATKTTIVQKVDKKVINVGNDLISTGANALELLQNAPFVLVDTQNGSINMRGSNNARIFIDGKPSNLSAMQVLKQIPSNNVKQIELITNPSAKYTAEGTGGIINFILKKNKQFGFNGSISAGIEHGENTRPSLSTNMNYREGKVNYFGNYSIAFGKSNTYTGLYRTDKNLNQDIDFVYDDVYQTTKIGADIYLNDKNTLSFFTSHAFDNADYLINTDVVANNTLVTNQDVVSKLKTHEQTYNANYKLSIDDNGQTLELDASYIETKNPEDNIYKEPINLTNKEYNYFNDIINNTDTWLFNIDYTKPLTKSSKIEAGIDVRLFSTFNQILSDQVIDTELVGNTKLNYDRDIYASYATYSTKFGKLSLQGGLRLELFKANGTFKNTNNQKTTTKPYTDKAVNLYPSLFATYYASDYDELYASYSRRVDRPSILQINPIPDFSTPLTISTGNQDLHPQYTDAFELNYTRSFKIGYASLGTIYRNTTDKIDRAVSTKNDLQILSFINNEGTDQFGLELFTELQLKKWWSTNISANYYNQNRTGIVSNQNITVKNHLFYTILNNRFSVNKKLSLQLNGMYVGQSKSPIFSRKPYGKIDFGAKLSILKGNGSLKFRVNDIFETMKIRFSSEKPLAQTGFLNSELRTFYLGFSYNFGSGKNKARKRKYRDKNETEGSGGIL